MSTFEVNFRSPSTLLDMTKEANQPRKEKNSDFGLPQADFKPITGGGSKWLKITAIIGGIVLAIGTGVVYWFLYHSPASPSKETPPRHEGYESEVPKADVDFIDNDASAKQDAQTHEVDKGLEALEEEGETKAFNTPLTTTPEKGIITKVNTPRGCYYVIVGSFIDDDLASDYANRLATQGANITIIAPAPGKYFYSVAVDQADSFDDANKKLKELKDTYGPDIWVMKY